MRNVNSDVSRNFLSSISLSRVIKSRVNRGRGSTKDQMKRFLTNSDVKARIPDNDDLSTASFRRINNLEVRSMSMNGAIERKSTYPTWSTLKTRITDQLSRIKIGGRLALPKKKFSKDSLSSFQTSFIKNVILSNETNEYRRERVRMEREEEGMTRRVQTKLDQKLGERLQKIRSFNQDNKLFELLLGKFEKNKKMTLVILSERQETLKSIKKENIGLGSQLKKIREVNKDLNSLKGRTKRDLGDDQNTAGTSDVNRNSLDLKKTALNYKTRSSFLMERFASPDDLHSFMERQKFVFLETLQQEDLFTSLEIEHHKKTAAIEMDCEHLKSMCLSLNRLNERYMDLEDDIKGIKDSIASLRLKVSPLSDILKTLSSSQMINLKDFDVSNHSDSQNCLNMLRFLLSSSSELKDQMITEVNKGTDSKVA